jgi:hypothetical protein
VEVVAFSNSATWSGREILKYKRLIIRYAIKIEDNFNEIYGFRLF